MKFYNKIIRSFVDLPEYNSMIIHSLVGCNLNCFGCFNYEKLVKTTPSSFYTKEDIYNYINLSGYMFDSIIFSGGEFLMNDIKEIRDLLQDIRDIFSGKLIINTNGTFPKKIQNLFFTNLIDGVHIDMKFPYHIYEKYNKEYIKDIIGIESNIGLWKVSESVLKSIDIVLKHNSKLDRIRTVKYPIMAIDDFLEIEKYINERKVKFNSSVIWNLNDFLKG